MPIPAATLAAIASAYVEPMTSIRGRRVHRLLMREFARFDGVLLATTLDGRAALLALREDGPAAVCCTDGRGPTAEIVEWPTLHGATLAISCDLLKDSLPVVGWSLQLPGFGTLTISAAEPAHADPAAITALLRRSPGETPRR